jgi:glycosyltransferase involved in cell wall biosynthesis
VTARCDLHVHTCYSKETGNYTLKRSSLGESYTTVEHVYETCRRRGMDFVTVSDHDTIEGALRLAGRPGTFISEEITTQFPEDSVPLHVLAWGITEEDHSDLQPLRPSVYELSAFLRERAIAYALAHPLYRMGPPLTVWHVERLMMLFRCWEGRNGGRPADSNDLACRLARAATPAYLAKLADRHGFEPAHEGPIALTAGSDDHAGIDLATTWTETAHADSVDEFLGEVRAGRTTPLGAHGSPVKLTNAMLGLFLNAYRERSATTSEVVEALLELFEEEHEDADEHHRAIMEAVSRTAQTLLEQARSGGAGLTGVDGLGGRVGAAALAAVLQVPLLATTRHQAGSRAGLREIEHGFFGPRRAVEEPRVLLFTDTFSETNGVAGTIRRLAAAGAAGQLPLRVVATGTHSSAGVLAVQPGWSIPVPTAEHLALAFAAPADLIARVEAERPEVVHLATPGPIGLVGLLCAKILGLPTVGSYHTELGQYALQLTRDLLLAEATALYVDWFYRQCDLVLPPTKAVGNALAERGMHSQLIWGRGVDTELFKPERRDEQLRAQLLAEGHVLAITVSRLSAEKRVDFLLSAFTIARRRHPGLRLVVIGDGPARRELEANAPNGVRFLGELHGRELATAYASADLFCLASATETFGQVLLEASASGLPVIVSDVGGAPELVGHEQTGLLVAPTDLAGYAAALELLASSATQRSALGSAGIGRAASRSWARSLEQLRVAYRTAALQTEEIDRRQLLLV